MLAKHPIVWSKIVAPLRDTVRLVDRDQRGLALGEHFGKPCHAKPLWGDEEELQLATQVVGRDTAGSFTIATRMNALNSEPSLLQLQHLIVHQRDERTDHESRPASCQSWQLVTE